MKTPDTITNAQDTESETPRLRTMREIEGERETAPVPVCEVTLVLTKDELAEAVDALRLAVQAMRITERRDPAVNTSLSALRKATMALLGVRR